MPVNDDVPGDDRTSLVQWWVGWAKDEYNPYVQIEADRLAAVQAEEVAVAVKEARRERLREISRGKQGMRFPGSRPWQAAGAFRTRQEWVDAGSPEPDYPPTKREKIEARLRQKKR